MKLLLGFDPLLYLGLKVKDEEKDDKTFQILDELSKYLVERTLELLPDSEVKQIQTPAQLFDKAKELIPDYKEKVEEFLEDFKKKYG